MSVAIANALSPRATLRGQRQGKVKNRAMLDFQYVWRVRGPEPQNLAFIIHDSWLDIEYSIPFPAAIGIPRALIADAPPPSKEYRTRNVE